MENESQLVKQEKPMMAIESAASSLAAQAKANVEARFLMALNRPRNWNDVRVALLAECKRPAFANNKSSYYKKPIGKGVEGLGIRFVEVAFRCMTNVLVENQMVFEDETKEVIKVTITDLEANTTFTMDVKVTKTVERSKPLEDGSFVSVRKNSRGKDVFTIPGTDDELLNKRGAAISKTIRNLGTRLIPGDLQDEATDIIKQVRLNKASEDPAAAKKKILDSFNGIGVKPSDLTEYLDHDVDQCSPAEIVDLRALYGAIKDGEATWVEVMDNKKLAEPTPEEDLKDKAGAAGDVIDINPEEPEEPEEPTRVCPDREDSDMFESFCNDSCDNQEGCPAWPDYVKPEDADEQPEADASQPKKKF